MGLFDDITDNDLRRIAALVAPIIKSDAIQVNRLPGANVCVFFKMLVCSGLCVFMWLFCMKVAQRGFAIRFFSTLA